MKKIINLSVIGLNLLAILAGFIFIFLYLYYDTCTDHDHFYIYNIFNHKSFFSEGRLTSVLISSLFYIAVPKIFNVHVNDVSNTFQPFVTGLFITITSIFFLKIYYLFSKEKKFILKRKSFFLIYPAIFILATTIPIPENPLGVFLFDAIASTLRYYDSLANYIFFVIYVYGIISSFFVQRKPIIQVLFIINAILLGISSECLYIIASIFGFFAVIFSFYLYRKNLLTKSQSKCIITCFISLIICCLTIIYLSPFSSGKIIGHSEVSLFENFNQLWQRFIPFCILLLNRYFIGNIIFTAILAALFTIVFYKKPENFKTVNILSLLLLLSLLLFISLTFFLGDCSQIYDFNFWIDYLPLKIMYKKTLILLIMFLTGYLVNNIQTDIYVKRIKILLIIFLWGTVIYYSPKTIQDFKDNIIQSKETRTQTYIADKMSLLYYNTDKIAILPISFLPDIYSSFLFRIRVKDSINKYREDVYEYKRKELEKTKTGLFTWTNLFGDSEASIDYLDYFYFTYNKKLLGIIFIDDKKAFEEYEKRKGYFKEKELKRPSFTAIKRQNNKIDIEKEIKENPSASYLYGAKCSYDTENLNYKSAIDSCTKAIKLNKFEENKMEHYYYLRALAYKADKDYKNAEKDLNIFLKLSPDSIYVMPDLADIYLLDNQPLKAIEILNKRNKILPYYNNLGIPTTYHSDIAKIYYAMGNYKKAIDEIIIEEKITDFDIDTDLQDLKDKLENQIK